MSQQLFYVKNNLKQLKHKYIKHLFSTPSPKRTGFLPTHFILKKILNMALIGSELDFIELSD